MRWPDTAKPERLRARAWIEQPDGRIAAMAGERCGKVRVAFVHGQAMAAFDFEALTVSFEHKRERAAGQGRASSVCA